MDYVPLHVHTTEGSVGDSILRTSEYVQKVKELGLKAAAVTDHGSMSSMYRLYNECKKVNVKPIIGMEAYMVEDIALKDNEHKYGSHLVLLAKNNEGLKNLLTLHNIASTDGFYYKPKIDFKLLKKYGKGIVGLSACVGGNIPKFILNEEKDSAVAFAILMNEYLDDFYLELQPGNFENQLKVNNELVRLSQEYNFPLVITNDIHYLNKEDYIAHDIHVKLNRHKEYSEELAYPDKCYYLMSGEELYNSFYKNEIVNDNILLNAIRNTIKIANDCNIELSSNIQMPVFYTDKDEKKELERLCYKELGKILRRVSNPDTYIKRLKRELNVISGKGFCGYFLIVQGYINDARKHGIAVGPGRGSCAGSLIAYLLGITQADPIEHGLIFERFLDPNREAIPDIDVDIEQGRRQELVDLIVERYGYDHCSLVSTLGIRKAKGAIRDAARILGYDTEVGNIISDMIPTVFYDDAGEKTTDLSISKCLESIKEFQEMYKTNSDIVDMAMSIENLPRSTSLHAAGLLISPVSLFEHIPLIKPENKNTLATSLDLEDAENQFVKVDLLGLSTLDVISSTEKMIDWHFDYKDKSLYEDEKVWKTIGSKYTTGIFQISSNTYKRRMPRIKPKNLDELAMCLALIRGACIQAGTDEVFMQVIEGKKQVEKVHPIYDSITKDTNGVIIFQEQIMQLAVEFGMNLTDGYRIVKAGCKKQAQTLQKYRKEFISLATKKNVNNIVANKMFDLVEASAAYTFNKAHALSYGMITYTEAYLKTHYTLEFMTQYLNHVYRKGKKAEIAEAIRECLRLKIEFLKPDINKSDWNFSIESRKIRIGMIAISGLGETAAESIVLIRNISSLEEMYERMDKRKINKRVMTAAIYSGMLDTVCNKSREKIYNEYLKLKKEKKENNTVKICNKDLPANSSNISFEINLLSGNFKISA